MPKPPEKLPELEIPRDLIDIYKRGIAGLDALLPEMRVREQARADAKTEAAQAYVERFGVTR